MTKIILILCFCGGMFVLAGEESVNVGCGVSFGLGGGKKAESAESPKTYGQIKPDFDVNAVQDDEYIKIMKDEHKGFLSNVTYFFEHDYQLTEDLFESKKCTVVYMNDYIVSYRIEHNEYCGGAHNICHVAVGTYGRDCLEQGPLTLKDIAKPEDIPELTKRIRQELVKMRGAKSYEELCLHQDAYPTNNFYFDDKGLHFFYNEYEIDCYAAGNFDVCIDWPVPDCVRRYHIDAK